MQYNQQAEKSKKSFDYPFRTSPLMKCISHAEALRTWRVVSFWEGESYWWRRPNKTNFGEPDLATIEI